eukprot:m.166067 g.166067  ORF g.166067 m.166067 type:complete len:93 (+) comp21094_c2_seq5:644-922(+)
MVAAYGTTRSNVAPLPRINPAIPVLRAIVVAVFQALGSVNGRSGREFWWHKDEIAGTKKKTTNKQKPGILRLVPHAVDGRCDGLADHASDGA